MSRVLFRLASRGNLLSDGHTTQMGSVYIAIDQCGRPNAVPAVVVTPPLERIYFCQPPQAIGISLQAGFVSLSLPALL